ncbi:MAG: T9SS type A sorting domain-containing protein [Saprospiraceae bacterium]|nr:T9SS type A sorting domain-containing protein [Saprospiraceae bacterium]
MFSTKITITNNNSSKPDLACLATGTLEVINNEKIKIEGLKIKNIGHGRAGESKIGFYLSLDTHFDQNDYFLDARSVSALAPGEVATLSFYEDIPSGNPPAGRYYLGYILDYDKKIDESNEDNNNDCYFDSPRVVVPERGNNNGGGNSNCTCTSITASAFCEDFEAFTTGGLNLKSNCFETWSGSLGGATDGIIESGNGNKYLKIKGQNVQNEQNVVLQLGDRVSGKYNLAFRIYLLSGNKGYFNVLHTFVPNSNHNKYAYEVYFNGNNSGHVRQGGRQTDFQYPSNSWFTVNQYFDIDNDQVTLTINGAFVASWEFSNTPDEYYNQVLKRLAAINFRALSGNDQYFVDDIKFTTVNNANNSIESREEEVNQLEAVETSTTFELNYYPNPVQNQLFVTFVTKEAQAVQLELWNAVGQVVKRHQVQAVTELTHEFDVTDLPTGMYYLKCVAGDNYMTKPVAIIE